MAVEQAEVEAQTPEVQESGAEQQETLGSILSDPEPSVDPDASTEAEEPPAPDPFDAIWSDPERRSLIRQRLLSEDEDIKAHLAKVENDARNAGAQAKESELRKQAGQRENVQRVAFAALKEAVEATGQAFDPDSFTPQQIAKLNRALAVPFEFNRSIEAEAIYQALDEWFAGKDVPAEARADAARIRNETGDRFAYLNRLAEGRDTAARNTMLGSLKLTDIPADAPLRKDIEAELRKRVAAERLAEEQGTSRNVQEGIANQPTPVRGTNAASVPYHQLTPEQRAAMSPEQRDAHVARYGG